MKTCLVFCLLVAGSASTLFANAANNKPINPPGNGQNVVVNGDIDHADFSIPNGNIASLHVKGKVDGQSTITIAEGRCGGGVTIDGKVDGQSTVVIRAAGDVVIGDKLDGQSSVEITTSGSVTINGEINGQCKVKIVCKNLTIKGPIDGGKGKTVVEYKCSGQENIGQVKDATVTKLR